MITSGQGRGRTADFPILSVPGVGSGEGPFAKINRPLTRRFAARCTNCIENTASAAHLRTPWCAGGAALLTCGFTVARGGVEPPTFRFSGVRLMRRE
jgi:hypothetical protein